MIKEEKIKEAWGVILDTLTDKKDIDFIINNNGYLITEKFMYTTEEVIFWCGVELVKHPKDNHLYRPKSLDGIETNNGWIKIENEEDLPKEKALYFIANSNPDIVFYSSNMISDLDNLKEMWEDGDITHYQPIEKPQPPIY